MAFTAIIVDDEPLARQELEYLLHDIGRVTVVAQGANGIEAVELIRKHAPDLVFLDVQMPGLDGFAVLKKLMERKVRLPQIVFATAYDEYAVRAFEVNAVDYLLKPFNRRRMEQTIEKLRPGNEKGADTHAKPDTGDAATAAKLDALLKLVEQQAQIQAVAAASERPSGKVIVRAQSRLLLVDQRDISFATIEGGTIHVVAAGVEGVSNFRTLEELMDVLDPEIFWRAHRSHLINIQHIREVVPWFKSSYQVRMDDGKKTELPVSRSQTKRLRELFNL